MLTTPRILFWVLFLFPWRSINGFVPTPANKGVTLIKAPCENAGVLLAQATGDLDEEKEEKEEHKKLENQNDGKKVTKKPRKRRSWDENFARLLEFHEEHGHPNVPVQYQEDPKLGSWLKAQRKTRHSMKPDKLAKLEALNITWDGVDKEKSDQRWEDKFQCLQKYKEMEGDCRVPQSHPKLGSWVSNQRQNYKGGKLAPYRIKKLESVGFVWRLRRSIDRDPPGHLEEQWKQKFEELLEYQKENGHCRVPRSYPENPSLGKWVNRQRKRHTDGDLRQDRKELLEEIGFTWNFEEIRDEAWNNLYNQLLKIKKKQQNWKGDGNNQREKTWASHAQQSELYHWELNQQDFYERGSLDLKREAKLAEIDYWNSLGLQKTAVGEN